MSASDDPWRGFAHDPRDPAAARLRAGDADRDIIHRILADGFADGRLDRDEYDERSTSVLAARTLGELPPLVVDLVPVQAIAALGQSSLVSASPADLQRRAEQEWESSRRHAIQGFVGSSLVCWAIWLASNWGDLSFQNSFPWPFIVMAVSLMNVIRVQFNRDELVAEELRQLERRQAKKLRSREQQPDDGSAP